MNDLKSQVISVSLRLTVFCFSEMFFLLFLCKEFILFFSVNSVRLWLPQIFATMNAMESLGANDTSMCAVLEHNAMAVSMNEDDKRVECALVGRRSLVIGCGV